jgi:hypothetical protein
MKPTVPRASPPRCRCSCCPYGWRPGSSTSPKGRSCGCGSSPTRSGTTATTTGLPRLGHGVPRAAWIALQLTPQNPNDQPTTPTGDDQLLPVSPAFPARQQRQDTWAQPPVAAALPDHWSVVTVGDGVTSPPARSGPVRSPLPVGPDPAVQQLPDDLPVDEGIRWMVEFPAAEQAGMGIRIPLTAARRAQGFDRILVYGLRGHGDDVAQLAALLDHHHYTDGLTLIPQGAPTNNTPDAAAFPPQQVSADGSVTVERGPPLATDPARDGPLAARLLSLPAGLFDHVRGADGLDQQDARQMAVALWPATLGYLLGTMLTPVLDPGGVEEARSWVLDNVRARGPLPTMAVGATPYGILPVTSLRLLQPWMMGNSPEALVTFLRRALPLWQASATATPRISADSADPDNDLVRILGMDASSRSFRARPVYGDAYWWTRLRWAGFRQPPLRRWWDADHQRGRNLLAYFGVPEWTPRLTRTSLGPDSATHPITRPLVQPQLVDGKEPLSETDPLPADTPLGDQTSGTYIDWLRQATVDQLRHDRDHYPGQPPQALLYRLLRQSLLTEYYQQAASGQPPPDEGPNLAAAARRPVVGIEEPEHVGFPGRPTKTPWDTLDEDVPGHPGTTWKDYLHDDPAPVGSPFQHLGELRASLTHLAGRPTAELERLLTETLDAFGYRLDAWITGVATARLAGSRAWLQDRPSPAGSLLLGGYGWVEDLRPAAPQPLDPTEQAAVTQQLGPAWQAGGFDPATPVYQPPPDNGGFIYAPSPQQAMTAAVLRNGYLTHRQTTNGQLLAIDLSARRMRHAKWLLEEANNGRPAAALLGYRFEQALHASGLDRYQQPFRRRYPLADRHGSSGQPDQPAATSLVTDGQALWSAWKAGQLPQGGSWGDGLPGPGADQDAISALLRQLDDLVDALNDLSVTEAVHQLIAGNPARAGAFLDALSKGHRAPDPQVLATRQERLTYHQRVLLILADDGAVVGNGWQQAPTHPRASAEPLLTAWLSRRLPNPTQVRSYVSYTDAHGSRHRAAVQLADLALGPLDFLALALQVGPTAQDGELERRLCSHAAPADASDPTADFTLDPAGADAGQQSIPQAAFVAQTLQDLLRISRPTAPTAGQDTAEQRQAGAGTLQPADLVAPNLDPAAFGGQLDVAELTSRATTVRETLRNLLAALEHDAEHADPVALRQTLFDVSLLGLPSAVPASPGEADQPLADRAAAAIQVLGKRLADADRVLLSGPAVPPAELTSRALLVLATVFDQTTPVLPRFTPPAIDQLRAAFDASDALIGPDRQAPDRWLQQLTHVRPALGRLDLARTASQLAGASRLPLRIAQLPYQPGDRWLGLPLPDPTATQPAVAGQLSLVAVVDGDYQHSSSWAGLVIDAWDEAIPAPTGSAGLAFHYQLPSHAPQALLLAVTPGGRTSWDDEALQAILAETLDLLGVRTVDLDTLPAPPQAPVGIGQVCPALYLPFNAAGDAISADLTGQ